ncbi:MAG: hypothetical protein HYZ44_09100 [Bacteroidetes bacterium]|nr:hypothetical protein [Bacteroidota bacterium]
MNKILLFFLFTTSLFSCSTPPGKPEECFTKVEQSQLISQVVRYSTKLPPDATQETKFDTAFDWYYDIAAQEYDWRACTKINEKEYYFLMTRKARSIWPAREAIGGKLSVDANKTLIEYEEVFRTWKMAEDSLNNRAFELFKLMTEQKDLTPFTSRYKGDRYIEFPDDRWYFDKEDKKWRDRSLDSARIVD